MYTVHRYLAVHQYLGKKAQEMIPLPQAAADSDLELLLTNLWIGKGGTTAVSIRKPSYHASSLRRTTAV
jgi:hypothetical protein